MKYPLLFHIIVILFLLANKTHAQQDAQFSQYMNNKLYYNPAAAGISRQYTQISAIHRSQWAGYQATFDDGGAPTTQVFSIDMPLTKYNLGTGLHFVHDQLGLVKNIEIQLSLAYQIKLNAGVLAIGARAGAYNFSLNPNNLRPVDPNDPLIRDLIANGRFNQFTSDFAVGLFFQGRDNKYFASASMNHLQRSDFSGNTQFGINKLSNHLTLMGGYNFDVSSSVVLTPSTIMKTDLNVYSFEGSLTGTYDGKYSLGVSMREQEAAIVMLGMNLLPDEKLGYKLRLGYSFDYTLEAKNAKETTSHEILLTYRLPAPKFYTPNPIRSPRFRF
jgi:type IX secretion system PorP/SprF family membrane protein